MNFKSIDILSEEEINKQYDYAFEMNGNEMSWMYWRVECSDGSRYYCYEPYYYNYICTGCCANGEPLGNHRCSGSAISCVESQGK